MPDSPAEPPRVPPGPVASAISSAIVALMRDYTGRGPTTARTMLDENTIVVTLRDSLTKAERTLTRHGQADEVRAMRRAIQIAMRDDMIAAVEAITGRTVEAFLSDNLHDPDVAVEVFVLRPVDNGGGTSSGEAARAARRHR